MKKKAVVIGGAGHIGTYLIPMLVEEGFETIAITRSMSKPYEDNPLWDKAKRVLMDREKDSDFIDKLCEMKPDIIVDLVNFNIEETKKIVSRFKDTDLSHYLYCSSCWAHGMAELLPFNPDDEHKEPLDEYGKDKFASEMYLKKEYEENGFPYTVIAPGQISGPGWTIINPWGNTSFRVVQDIADGKEIFLPNFGQEIIHHVHGYDVAQMFLKAITHRDNALGKVFDAEAESHITLYGYAKHLYKFFNKEPKIGFLPWDKWCEYEGNKDECDHTYYHIVRSGTFSIENAKKLLEYHPKYTNLETIDLAIQSYINRGLVKVK
ncbi:MAG: NAD-dependent epimerase/dehydratase family protein [Erysipelotrichaceae bacterium]|nr:NAD-dependent epimerase/dehydratase family protein [Erysipelotrichaceae bacterium]